MLGDQERNSLELAYAETGTYLKVCFCGTGGWGGQEAIPFLCPQLMVPSFYLFSGQLFHPFSLGLAWYGCSPASPLLLPEPRLVSSSTLWKVPPSNRGLSPWH